MPVFPFLQYQAKTEAPPGAAIAVSRFESAWHQPWSDPVRVARNPQIAIALAASGLFFSPQQAGELIFEDKWHFQWSEPIVKSKAGLGTGLQQFFAYTQTPSNINIPWFANLSEPVRTKPGIRAAAQPYFQYPPDPFAWVGTPWYSNLSEPVRIKPGIRAAAQPYFQYPPDPFAWVGTPWYSNFSEPVRIKPGIRAAAQPYFQYPPDPFGWVGIPWYSNFSEPVRIKPGAKVANQQFSIFNPFPITSITWFEWFSEPVRQKRGPPPPIQPFLQFFPNPLVSFGWFGNLSDPVRVKPRLLEGLQRDLGRAEFVPTNYTASMYSVENLDFFLGVLSQFNIPITAYVDIIAKNPKYLGNMGIIENVAEPSIVASIATTSTAGTSGAPVSTVAGARIAIISR